MDSHVSCDLFLGLVVEHLLDALRIFIPSVVERIEDWLLLRTDFISEETERDNNR